MPESPLNFAIKPNPAVQLRIVHEDPDLIIVDKQAGVVTQPGKGHATDSVLNGVFALRDGVMGKILHNLGERRDYGLLHRLDKETSGLLVVAKTPNAYDQLRRDFESRTVDKEYLAITAGIPHPKQGVVQARLKEVEVPNPDPKAWKNASIKKVVISRQGQEAISAYKVLSHVESPDAAIVQVTIKTGRLHQIRAHMTFLNCQVLGDDIYTALTPPKIENQKSGGGKIENLPRPPRLCLHAFHLGFKHPATGKWTHFRTPLPNDLAKYAAKLGLTMPETQI